MLGTYFNVANVILSSTENLHFNTVIPATLAASYDLGFNQSTSSSTCAFKEDNNITCFKFIMPKLMWISNVSIIIKIRVANIILLTRWD